MTRAPRALSIAALAAAALALAVASAAATARIYVPSSVSIVSDGLQFSGRVKAPKFEPCEELRRVVLFKAIAGGPDEAVGRDTTDARGRWSIEPQGSAGISMSRFYARALKLPQGTAGTVYVCRAGRSKTVKPAF